MLLAGGPTMLSWPDSVCERLAAGGQRVVRYDLRDCGASTTVDPEAPGYHLRDLAADAAALVGTLGAVTEQARATAARIWDRTPSSEPSVQQANQLGMVFARLDCAPRWRQRLGQLTLPTLVVHGRADPNFPVGNGEALAAAIPAARLLVLDDMGTALRDAAAGEVTAAMLAL